MIPVRRRDHRPGRGAARGITLAALICAGGWTALIVGWLTWRAVAG